MNTPAPENPSAFPEVFTTDNNRNDPHKPFEPDVYSAGGMSLRDYFAAKAMQATISNIGDIAPGASREYLAEISYGMADAMLAERAKKKTS